MVEEQPDKQNEVKNADDESKHRQYVAKEHILRDERKPMPDRGPGEPGWPRVQAICDFVHNHIAFDYQKADSTRSAFGGFNDRTGVCRDFAHLAITLCRAMNIPARYCTGYLGDIGVPADPAPMDFSAWFEAYLGGRWYTFDARHNHPRIGRILIATGRDATDVAISTSFGSANLVRFDIVTDEVVIPEPRYGT